MATQNVLSSSFFRSRVYLHDEAYLLYDEMISNFVLIIRFASYYLKYDGPTCFILILIEYISNCKA